MRIAGAASLDEVMSLRRSHAEATADAAVLARGAHLGERVASQVAAAAPLTLGELAIDGADLREVLAVPEGPPIGRVLEALLQDASKTHP